MTHLTGTDEPGRSVQSLVSAIACIAVFGVGMGFSMPLLALILEARGIDTSVIGLNAAMTFLGVIIAAPAVPWAVRAIGARAVMLGCLVGGLLFFALMVLSESLPLWFVLRFGAGVAGSGLFTTSEAWIGSLAGERERGRIMAIYATVLSVALCLGPLLVPVTGIVGWAPIVANTGLVMLAGLPLILTPVRLGMAEEAARLSLGVLISVLPAALGAVLVFGLFEGGTLALLPIWGMQVGFSPNLAALSLSALYLGGIVLQLPLGWASDRTERVSVLRICGLAALLGGLVLPLLGDAVELIFIVLFLWGGFAGALYPVALSAVGDRFRGERLVAANAAVVMCYGFGSLAGPVLAGSMMSAFGANGLPWLIAAAAACFLITSFVAGRQIGHQ